MNKDAVQYFRGKYKAMEPNELALEASRKNDLSEEARSALESVVSDKGLSVAMLEQYASVEANQANSDITSGSGIKRRMFKTHIHRVCLMELWGIAGCLPGVALTASSSGPIWYTPLLYLAGAIGASIIGLPLGLIALVGGRNRADGASKIACAITFIFGLLTSYVLYRYR